MRTVEQSFTLVKNLKYLRNKNGLSQAALAKIIGMPKGTYGTFECSGYGVGPERLQKIYDFYKIDEKTALMNHQAFIKKIEGL